MLFRSPNPHPGTDLVFKLPGRYTGPVTMGSPNGWGTFVFEGGDLAGDMYVGFFSAGNFSGFGTYYHNAPNKLKGSVFVGFFKDQLKDGPGVYAFADGTPTQEGRWEKGRLDKPSKTFLMETMKGLPFCQGSDATQWTECFGFLEFESIQGQALQKRDGTSYAGGFRNGLPDGVGSFFDKRRYLDYQGELKGGKYEGVGTEFFDVAGYSFYSGGFLDNKRHGKGVSQSGGALNDDRGGRLMERYEGDYVNGARTGQGTLYREMDFTYVGGFKNNLFDGEGTYTPERKPGGGEPVVQQGMWEKGKLLKPGQSPAEAGRKKK